LLEISDQKQMNQLGKAIVVIVLAQAICVGLGLWLQDRFAHSLKGGWGETQTASTPRTDGRDAEHMPGQANEKSLTANIGTWNEAFAIRAMTFFWICGLQSVVAYLILTRVRTDVSRKETRSAQESLRRHRELVRTRDAVIFGMAKLAESRDPDTGYHLERVARYSTRLAAALQRIPAYHDSVTPSFVKLIGISSALHDIGKVGVRDSVLLKTSSLDRPERAAIEQHPAIGGECIKEIELRLGSTNFLQMAREIAFSHHECWDGMGYPRGLVGEEIPLAARIVAIADVYDALSTKRPYKDPIPHERCVAIIKSGAGTQFDPRLVSVFLEIESEFRDIAGRWADPIESEDSQEASIEQELDGGAPFCESDGEEEMTVLSTA